MKVEYHTARVQAGGRVCDIVVGRISKQAFVAEESVLGLLLAGDDTDRFLVTGGYSRLLLWKADSAEPKLVSVLDFAGVCSFVEYLAALVPGSFSVDDVTDSFFYAMMMEQAVGEMSSFKKQKIFNSPRQASESLPWQTSEFFNTVERHILAEPVVDFGPGFRVPSVLNMGPAEYLRSIVCKARHREAMHLPYQSLSLVRMYEPLEIQEINDSMDRQVALLPVGQINELQFVDGKTPDSPVNLRMALAACFRTKWDPMEIGFLYEHRMCFKAGALKAGVPGRWVCTECGCDGSLRFMLFTHSLFHDTAVSVTCACRQMRSAVVCPGDYGVVPPTAGIASLYAHREKLCPFFTEKLQGILDMLPSTLYE